MVALLAILIVGGLGSIILATIGGILFAKNVQKKARKNLRALGNPISAGLLGGGKLSGDSALLNSLLEDKWKTKTMKEITVASQKLSKGAAGGATNA